MNYYDRHWLEIYKIVKKYYKFHGDLYAKRDFRTKDGYTYNENGICIYNWVNSQIQSFKNGCLSEERINLLKKLNIDFNRNINDEKFEYHLSLATNYYNYHNNLEIPLNFKTKDGITYDSDGFNLGCWINAIRQTHSGYNKLKLTDERIEKLKAIGMRFNYKTNYKNWYEMYELCKIYKKYYGDLKIPYNFKSIDMINYDPNGVSLGNWLFTQRQKYFNDSLEDEKIYLLEKLGYDFGEKVSYDELWDNNYKIVLNYYNHYKNIDIKQDFFTNDGINYDPNGTYKPGVWLRSQRLGYISKAKRSISPYRIKKLDNLNMKWFTSSYDIRLQNEIITKENKDRKNIEIYNRVMTFLNKYVVDNICKEDLNKEFIKTLK